MSSLLTVTSVEIGDKTYMIGRPTFGESSKAYNRLMKLARVYGDEVLDQTELGLFQFGTLAGLVSDEDLKFFIELYGKITQVSLGGSQTLPLNSEANRTTVFGDAFQDSFAWLDAATEVVFGASLKKLASGQRKVVALAEQKEKNTQ